MRCVGHPREIGTWCGGDTSSLIASPIAGVVSRFPWHHATRYVLEVNDTSSLT